MSAAFDVMSNVLYAMCLVLLVFFKGDVAFQSCNFNIHNRVFGYLPPLHTSLLL